MIPVVEALNIVESTAKILSPAEVSLEDALGYAAAEDILSDVDIPPFDNSAMDGYAVLAADTADAGVDFEDPVVLDVVDDIPAGKKPEKSIGPGQAARIMTGAMVPEGADAIVMVEDTESADSTVVVHNRAKPADHIRRSGSDISRGDTVLPKGSVIRPAAMGVLASINKTTVPVITKPKVAYLTTGDELVEPGEELAPGKIRNANRYSLLGMLRESGADFEYTGTAGDTKESIREAVKKCFTADVIITTGAVSVGQYDYVEEALVELGMTARFWKVAQKPGKPLLFGAIGESIFFGLPGNPVSVMVTCFVYVLPALRKMMGIEEFRNRKVNAILGGDFTMDGKRTNFARGGYTIKDGVYHASAFERQGSGMLSTMNDADCLLIFPAGKKQFPAGSIVEIMPLF